MFRRRKRVVVGLSLAAVGLLSIPGIARAQQHCGRAQQLYGNRGIFDRCRCGIGNAYRGPYASGSGNNPWGSGNRFYDSTGRWTGDGVDTMATASRTRQPSVNTQPNCPN